MCRAGSLDQGCAGHGVGPGCRWTRAERFHAFLLQTLTEWWQTMGCYIFSEKYEQLSYFDFAKVYFSECICPKCIFWKFFPKCIFPKCIFLMCIFPNCIFLKCTFLTCIFAKWIFPKYIFPKCIFEVYLAHLRIFLGLGVKFPFRCQYNELAVDWLSLFPHFMSFLSSLISFCCQYWLFFVPNTSISICLQSWRGSKKVQHFNNNQIEQTAEIHKNTLELTLKSGKNQL